MVSPSIPVYLDPPNWPQQESVVGSQGLHLPLPPLPPLQPIASVGGGGFQGSIRPGSMADRARLSKMPQPEAALKCPRCDSINTKFCYYNNYSLSQPRHFCKTCRRCWTRGGALRNVPVGGGCRSNKRSKSSGRSKSPIKADRQSGSTSTTPANSSSSTSNTTHDVISHLPFLPTLNHFTDYVSEFVGLNFGAIPSPLVATNGNTAGACNDVEFQIGINSGGGNNGGFMLSNGLNEQSRLPTLQLVHHQQHQQFPFLTNLDSPIGLLQFEGGNVVGDGGWLFRSKTFDSGASGIPQLTPVKMEENQGLSSKNLLGSSGNDHQFWAASGNAWTDIPSVTSSASHLL